MTRSYIFLLFMLAYTVGMNDAAAQFRPGLAKPLKRAMPAHTGRKTSRVPVTPKPVVLPTYEMQFSRIRASEIWPEQRHRDTMLARLGIFCSERGGLLYRVHPKDTVFVLVELEAPPNRFDSAEEGNFSSNTCVLLQDLNRDGSPEALAGFWRHWQGSGGRASWVGIKLIDISGPPRLLLNAIIEDTESGWDTGPDPNQPIFTTIGRERYVKLGGEDIRLPLMDSEKYFYKVKSADPSVYIGKVLTHEGAWNTKKRVLTPLKPGRYHYRDDHLVWVGK
ncbi:MAG TPA: hypothetical protein VF629_11750 [Hymenobacter sp.]|jgi:hypothetical protein|uniref:hypothetical protein n=1 Tax=Hymenobacter sp. TaxID=1898978 RepID=UPI002EDA2612